LAARLADTRYAAHHVADIGTALGHRAPLLRE
jgi:hypothetical protein